MSIRSNDDVGSRARRALPVLVVGVLVPVALTGVVLALLWDRLPAVVATHWAADGTPDGFTTRGLPLVLVALGLPLVVGLVLFAVVLRVPGTAPGVRQAMAVPGAVATMLAALTITGLAIQVDLTDARQAGSGWLPLVVGVAAGLLGGALYHRLAPAAQPLPDRVDGPDPRAPRLHGAPPLAWTGRATMTARGWLAALTTLAAIVAVLVALAVAADGGFTRPMAVAVALVAALSLLLLALLCTYRVVVGARQVSVVGLAGWPRIAVPLAGVHAAAVTDVRIRSWGGIGLRYRSGGTGVITRSGPALSLERTDGSVVLITVEDPDQAAATVNSLLDRAADAA